MHNSSRTKNPWHNNHGSSKKHQIANEKKTEQKFKQAQVKLQAAVQKYAKDFESSSEEEELESDNVIDNLLKYYGDKHLLGRTEGFLQEAFVSNALTCLICISTVKRSDAVWSCVECYSLFHLNCIQRWSKDTITQLKIASNSQIQLSMITLKWSCPKCRWDYKPADVPSDYYCFCKKQQNPTYQALLVPHSCGETCSKQLLPFCGHNCTLLCHPGPCPPCPKTINTSCYCKKEPSKLQRCSNKHWSCGSSCNQLLACGKHKCSQPCHADNCLPCPKKSIQKCLCGSSQKLRECAFPVWQCDKVCDRPLSCGYHNCSDVCHTGACGSCALANTRTCPCGKVNYNLPCTEDTPTCGDTCGKVLECGMHICPQRCHKDKCGLCVETVEKSCRCGLHRREVQCKKPFLCDTKCKNMKDCNRHPCNRKCCDGECPPCEKPCNKTLNCGNHKCASVCHKGPCYPCNLTEKVYCHCGQTEIAVPCGRKQRTRPPKCQQLCNNPPDCHHLQRTKHTCHFGDCPPCKQMCNKDRSLCSHLCPAPCHSAVMVKTEAQKASMPWEQTGPQIEKKSLPCPDCIVPVSVTCLGGHETCDWPCYNAKPSSCQRPCGRILSCDNHSCSNPCHLVTDAVNGVKAGSNCETCYEDCKKDRPEGCNHQCPKPCHPGICAPCTQIIKIKCHCGLTQLYVNCNDWTKSDDKSVLQSCNNQCPNNFPCGHRCKTNCHLGSCPNAEQCKKKVKVFCACKRLKKEFSCETVRNGKADVPCDEICQEKKLEEKKVQQMEREKRKLEEELKNKEELRKYEKLFQNKKKNKEKRSVENAVEKSLLEKYWVLFSITIVAISFFLYAVLA